MSSFSYITYVRRIDRQPVLNFMIREFDSSGNRLFYINSYGVSVTETSKSFTALGDGSFYVLNKSSTPVFFNGLQITSIAFRRENGYPANNLRIRVTGTTFDDTYRYDGYVVSFRGADVGSLQLSTPLTQQNGSNVILQPYQSIEFGATYSVLNVNKLNLQYYGNSKVNPHRNKGTIDINFNVITYADAALTQPIINPLTVSVNLINTGYVPNAFPVS